MFPSGGPVSAAELERSGPNHVRRTGSGGNLQSPPSQKRENAVPVRPHAAHHQTPRRALRVQDAHLCEEHTDRTYSLELQPRIVLSNHQTGLNLTEKLTFYIIYNLYFIFIYYLYYIL